MRRDECDRLRRGSRHPTSGSVDDTGTSSLTETRPTPYRAVVCALATGIALGCASGRQLRGPAMVDAVPIGEIEYTLLLVGDAGYAEADDPVLANMSASAARTPNHAAMVFLGDNLYPAGLVDEGDADRQRGERILLAQLGAVRLAGARGIFVPGNHDWDRGGPEGWDKVRRQGLFLESQGVAMLPARGCPGPSVVDLASSVRLIVLDTQWWLHDGPKPVHPTSACPADSEAEVLDSLAAALASAGTRHVVVASHHPLESTGAHGGYYGWRDHIFPLTRVVGWLWVPLPIVGSAYPLYRSLRPTAQNQAGSANRSMRAALDSVLSIHPPLAYAAGHDHSLQVMEGDAAAGYLLVSGAGGSELTPVGKAESTLFARAASGFMRIDFMRNGRVRLAVLTTDRDGNETEEYSRWLDIER